jgi:hypothetical protein
VTDQENEAKIHVLTLVPFEFEDERKESWCRHTRCSFTVDRKERSVRCKLCGGEVDPYTAIDAIAQLWGEWESRRKHCEERAKAAEQRLADLERDERNCRSRLSGLHKKIMENEPADFAEAIALLRSRQNYTREWTQRRHDLLAKHGGGA